MSKWFAADGEVLKNIPEHRVKVFIESIDRRTDSECWPWRKLWHTPYGHGAMRIRGRAVLVHRIAFTLWVGSIPDGMLVCHHCDNPPCCNPAHLFLGTIKTNAEDMSRKGRAPATRHPEKYLESAKLASASAPLGERCSWAKLNAAQVSEIRALRGKQSQSVIAARFGVSQSLVGAIQRGETWKHL